MAAFLVIRGVDRGSGVPAITDGFCGKDKYVEFHDGFGILDLWALHLERSDWVRNEAGFNEEPKLVQFAGETLDSYVRYWRRRGFQVEEITDEHAKEFRAQVEVAKLARNAFRNHANELYQSERLHLVDARSERSL